MLPFDPSLRAATPGTVVALPTGGVDGIEQELLKALQQAGKVEARVLQVLGQSALIDFLDLGSAKVRTEVPLRAGDVFTAVVEPRAEGSAEPLKLRIAQVRHAPAAPLKAEHLAGQLAEMDLPVDPKHQAMARALVKHAGMVSKEAMQQLNDALNRLAVRQAEAPAGAAPDAKAVADPKAALDLKAAPLPADAPRAASLLSKGPPVPVKVLEAAAFLVARGLPVEEDAVSWVASRLAQAGTSGERLGAIARQLASTPSAATQPAAAALLELALPEGDATQTAAHLAKLVEALTPPEARIAKAIPAGPRAPDPPDTATPPEPGDATEPAPARGARAEAPAGPGVRTAPDAAPRATQEPLARLTEALTAVLEKAVQSGVASEPLKEALAEVRFGQLVNTAAPDPQAPLGERSLAIPLFWSNGSGEIRVQVQEREGRKRSAGGAEETRVVVTLDTAHLERVRVDLLLGQKQLNCQVSVEDPAVAEVLRERLPELKEALETTGLRVNALGVKRALPKGDGIPVDSLRQVDVWL